MMAITQLTPVSVAAPAAGQPVTAAGSMSPDWFDDDEFFAGIVGYNPLAGSPARVPARVPEVVMAIDASNIDATSDVTWGTAAQGVTGKARVKCPFAKADGAVCHVEFPKRK